MFRALGPNEETRVTTSDDLERMAIIKHHLEEMLKIFPQPTEEHYAAARAEVARAGDEKIPEIAIRDATFHSINRFTGKFDARRFREILPESLEQMK